MSISHLLLFFSILLIATFSKSFAQDYLCSGTNVGVLVVIKNPHDCSKYFLCFNGHLSGEGACGSGFWFDGANCVSQDSMTCIEFPVNPDCAPTLVDYYPFPYDCSRYVECYHGNETVHDCPENLYFNPDEKRCVDIFSSNCGGYTVAPPWTTPDSSICWGVQPNRTVLVAYPGDCSKYYICHGVNVTVGECPDGLVFNEGRQICDFSESNTCDDDTTPPNNPDEIIDDTRCSDGNTEYWPFGDICDKFVACYKGQGYVLDCPAGLYFDPPSKSCLEIGVADCGLTTPPPRTEATTQPGWTPDPYCPWPSTERTKTPYPGDCTKWIECYYGIKTIMTCTPGLYFNPVALVCDYPWQAGCYQ